MSKARPLLPIAALATLLALDSNAAAPGAMPGRHADTVVIDSFDSLSQWRTNPSAGVEVSIHPDKGIHGGAMRVDFDFHGHQGYWIVHRELDLKLPPNFQFNFSIRGQSPANNLEFKLVDRDHESVWWTKNPDFNLPRDWQSLTRRKPEICYAWGGALRRYYDLRQLSAIEFAISTGTGGKGSVWIDDLTLTPLDLESPFAFTARVASNPLVGTWETAVSNPDGSGAKLDFESEGTFKSMLGFMLPFKYSVARDSLITEFDDSPNAQSHVFTTQFTIRDGSLAQKGENLLGRDVVMKRVGASRGGPSIRGVWTFNDYMGATAFVAFDEDGKAELRIPTRTCSASWREAAPGHLVVSINGETREADFSIENDVLVIKSAGAELSYNRRRRSP